MKKKGRRVTSGYSDDIFDTINLAPMSCWMEGRVSVKAGRQQRKVNNNMRVKKNK